MYLCSDNSLDNGVQGLRGETGVDSFKTLQWVAVRIFQITSRYWLVHAKLLSNLRSVLQCLSEADVKISVSSLSCQILCGLKAVRQL